MSSVRCLEIRLSIPDNEAGTALATLQRLGVELGGLARADVYRCAVEQSRFEAALGAFRSIETLFNPNKHVLRVRSSADPQPGEVWIDERDSPQPARDRASLASIPARAAEAGGIRVGGRRLPGVSHLERFTSWMLTDEAGNPAAPALVAAATETLLCNPAFQRATTA